jgi:hypothetical protein
MPQIWLTDHELSAHLDCTAEEARQLAMGGGWTRKRSRDGLSRTCLPDRLIDSYILDLAYRLMDVSNEPPIREASLRVRTDDRNRITEVTFMQRAP